MDEQEGTKGVKKGKAATVAALLDVLLFVGKCSAPGTVREGNSLSGFP